MPCFAVFDPDTGRILRTGHAPEDAIGQQALDGEGVFSSGEVLDDERHYIRNWAVAVYPPRPGPWAVFDYDAEEWTDPRTPEQVLADERAAARAHVPREVSVMQAMIVVGEPLWTSAMALADDETLPWAMRAAIRGATNLVRHSETMDTIAYILGLSSDEVDELFVQAAQIKL